MTTGKKDIKERVEQGGVVFEQFGLSPIVGRVFAYLLLSEPPHRSFYEIQEFLGASKSSISNALKFLMNDGGVDYITFSGDRKRYFKVNPEKWLNVIKGQVHQLNLMQVFLNNVINDRTDKHAEFNQGLKQVYDFQDFVSVGYQKMIDDWEKNHE